MPNNWKINGIEGRGKLPAIAGTFSGPLVVIGGASCLWDDLSQVTGTPDYMAINCTGFLARKTVKHWATCHPEFLPFYLGIYRETYFPTTTENAEFNFFAHIFQTDIQTHSARDAANLWQFALTGGSSAMFAVQVGLCLGYDPIWLAGIPLEPSGCVYDPPWVEPFDYAMYQPVWTAVAETFAGRVKSFSGFTRELLGAP